MTTVPFLDLAAMHAEVADEVQAGFERVIGATSFAGGPDVAAFEEEFAAASGRRHCVGVANGTDALELALRALSIGRGDEVVLPANTFVATAEAVVRAGATPVLADVDRATLLVDPDAMAAAVTSRTAALVPVHLYGQIAPMPAVQALAARRGLAVVEDAAQSQGATQYGEHVGAGSDAASTSFYPGKNLGAYGDAGAVLSDRQDLADAVRLLGNHGSPSKYVHERVGFNSRLDTLQAVVLRAKLTRLEAWNERRREAAERYADLLGGLDVVLPRTAPGNVHVWHLYVIRVQASRRQAVMSALTAAGVGTGVHYPAPVHLHRAFADLGRPGDFPESEAASEEMISLPMHPALTAAMQEHVATALARALSIAA